MGNLEIHIFRASAEGGYDPSHTRARQVRRIREIRRPQAAAITSQGIVPQHSVHGFSGFCGPDQYRLT